ncbi:MAG: PEGA domain-containing protein [Myxococcota bacterium]
MKISKILILFVACAAMTCFCVTQTAFAQEASRSYKSLSTAEKKEMASLIEAGKSAYDRGEFDKSLRYFQDAYDILQHPDLLYRIGLCYERLGEDQEAVRYYRSFLKEVPDAKERGRIEKQIRVIEGRLAERASRIRVNTDPTGAVVFINDEINGPAGYTPTELPVSAGSYKLIIKKEGYRDVVDTVEVPEGQTVQLKYPLQKENVGGEGGGGVSISKGPILLGAIGFISLGVGIFSYAKYTEKQALIESWQDQSRDISRPANFRETYDERNLYGGVAVGTGVIALGALTWGTVLLVRDLNADGSAARPTGGRDRRLSIAPLFGADGTAGLRFQTRF